MILGPFWPGAVGKFDFKLYYRAGPHQNLAPMSVAAGPSVTACVRGRGHPAGWCVGTASLQYRWSHDPQPFWFQFCSPPSCWPLSFLVPAWFAAMASGEFTCYVLKFVTLDSKLREYYGQTDVKRSQTQGQVCEVRLQYHLSNPQSSFEIEALGRPMLKHNVLLQEANNTAMAMKDDASVRGACFSCRVLGSQ